jgi:hypothetical protein
MMDLRLTAVLSLIEVVGLTGFKGTLDLTRASQFIPLFSRFLAFFVVQYVALKIYRMAIYTHFLSPLRHIPGPKVCPSVQS